MIEILMVIGIMSGIGFLISLKAEFDRQEKEERRLKRRIIMAYYRGKQEGMGEWLKR